VGLNVDIIDGNAHRCSHAVGFPFSSTAALIYIAATVW